MQQTELPGYRPEFKEPERDSTTRVGRYVDFLKKRLPNKERYNDLILAYEPDPINAEELSKAPLFEFGPGFKEPVNPKPGTEPATLPLDREQMQLLLARILPASLVPFFQEKVVFDFEPVDPAHPMGPLVSFDSQGKIHITFYRPNFYTEGAPQAMKKSGDKTEKLTARYVARWLDPSKVALFLGKMISKMIPPPDNWGKIVEPKFSVTKNKRGKGGQPKKLSKKEKNETQLLKQWDDFVGLCLTAPDLAKQRYSEAYQYFKDQAESFNSLTTDNLALARLKTAQTNGQLQLQDIIIDYDEMKTDQEKAAEGGLSPQLRWYERFIATLNRGLVPFGYKITYKLPEDPERAALLAEDDKEIKTLLETMDEENRDKEFGELLAGAKDYEQKARNESRRYLLAASQAGEFAEWRIYAWLYKFSRLFRESKGHNISEDDYKDLQLIYSQSDKVGNRLGTGVLPFEAIAVNPEEKREARYYGRKVFVYVRKDRAKYVKEVEKKVRAKSDRAIMDASEKAFDQFKTAGGYLPYNAMYDGSPSGMSVPTGSLDQLLGESLGRNVSEFMGNLGVEKISPDAKAVAMAYYDYYNSIGRVKDKYMKPIALEVIGRYTNDLNRPPEERVAELTSFKAADVMRTGDVKYVFEKAQEALGTIEQINNAIGSQANEWIKAGRITATTFEGLAIVSADGTKQERLPGIKDLLLAGEANPNNIYQAVMPLIDYQFRTNRILGQQEARNLFAFLQQVGLQKNLTLLKQAVEYRGELQLPYLSDIQAAAEEIKGRAELILGPATDELPDESVLTTLEEMRIIDKRELERIEVRTEAEKTEGQETATAEAIAAINEPATRAKKLEYIQGKIATASKETRSLLVDKLIASALARLDLSLYEISNDPTNPPNYKNKFDAWLQTEGRIFSASALSKPRSDLGKATGLMDEPATLREGIDQKSRVVDSLSRSLYFEKYHLEQVKKGPRVRLPERDEEEES